jgi:hypothetical protein
MDMTTISANGTSSNDDDNRSYTTVRTETVSPEGIIVIRFVCTPKE